MTREKKRTENGSLWNTIRNTIRANQSPLAVSILRLIAKWSIIILNSGPHDLKYRFGRSVLYSSII